MMPSEGNRSPRSFGPRFAAFWFVAGFPLSFASPGATVAIAMVAAYGLYEWARGTPMPDDLRRIGKVAALAWAGLVIVDTVNGGSAWDNLKTAVDYLPVLIIPPLALGFRLSGISVEAVDRVLMATIALAVAMSCVQWLWFGIDRPGGLNLNTIPYAFVVLLWGTFLLARGLGELRGKRAAAALLGALAALVPIVLSGSRAVWICTLAAYAIIGLRWFAAERKTMAMALVAAGVVAVLVLSSFSTMVQARVTHFWSEAQAVAEAGYIGTDGSIGRRVAMIRGGWLAFLDKPFLGSGLAESMQAVIDHSSSNGPDLSVHTHIHNDYIAHMVAYGVGGLVFLAVYFWLVIRMASYSRLPSYRWAGKAIAAALALYMVADVGFNMDPMTGAAALVAGLLLCFPEQERDRPE